MLGRTVSHYEVLDQIGGGGMGVVYRARDTRLGRTVALKFLSPQLAGSEAHKERFLREARAAATLEHPSICSVYDLGETEEGGFFIAMALCPGESLKDRLARGPLAPEDALRVALHIAEGLASAHARGIVHRDIKPGNVMVGEDDSVKLVDFGLAKLAEDPEHLTRTGTVVGTAAYMSPEQVLGEEVDHRTDLWSLGVLLYEMLAGVRPFRGERDQAVMHSIVARDFAVEPLPQGEAPVLTPLLARLLAKAPAERYQSAAEVVADLRLLLGLPGNTHSKTTPLSVPWQPASVARSAAVSAATLVSGAPLRPVETPSWTARFLPRRRWVTAAALAVLALLALTAYRALGRSTDPLPDAGQVAPERQVLAVLPFKDLSGLTGGQLLGDGLSETVSARLASVAGVQVVPPSAAAAGSAVTDPRDAARELGADLILQGTVQRSGDRVRITYAVLEAERGVQLAGNTLTGPDADLFAIQDRLAASVVRALDLEPGRRAGDAPPSLATADQQVRYLRAMGHLRRYDRVESVDEALGLLEALGAEAPRSAPVQAALARAYLQKFNLTREPRWVDLAVEAGASARQLDPEDPEVDVTLGTLYTRTGRPREALAAFERALAAQPEHFDALLGLARAQDAAGAAPAAEATYRQAIALRPAYWGGYSKLGGFYYARGRYEQAAAMFKRATELAPDNARAFSNLGGSYQSLGDFRRALAAYEKSVQLSPTALAYSGLGGMQFFLGRTRAAASSFEKAVELTPQHFYVWANLGDAYRWTPGLEPKAAAAYARAIALAREELRVNPQDGVVHSVLALCLAKTGDDAAAERHVRAALASAPDSPELLYNAALVAGLAGRRAEALRLLGRAAEGGYSRALIASEPELAGLRGEAAFQAIVRGYNRGVF
ncbi:MAG TPA: protein kinase [Thermoanaerobaculia bacterium]|nr:protein kinase [Thermoanaerobaculia bacterium]